MSELACCNIVVTLIKLRAIVVSNCNNRIMIQSMENVKYINLYNIHCLMSQVRILALADLYQVSTVSRQSTGSLTSIK